jgi:hypothetical protein
MDKPTFDRNRPLSWSAISSFEYDPEQWYRKYALGQEDAATKEMLFGSEVGKKLATDPSYLPHIKRYPIFEYELRFFFAGIPMIGFIDGWCPSTLDLGEYKTGKKPWTQKRADEHGQFDAYLLGLWTMHKIRPEDVRLHLHWMPTQDNGDFSISFIDEKDCRTFKTKRTMRNVLDFGMRINRVYREMDAYCKNHG